jgi:hypothetical protein
VHIQVEPVGEVYAALLHLARRQCPTFSLTWREDVGQSQSARVVADALASTLIAEERVREWPGTRMLGAPVPLRRYRFTDDALSVLLAAPSLYAWQAPDRPEDLAFYAEDGAVWLGSIAHERAAFFGPAAPSRKELNLAVPGLFVREGYRKKHRRADV